MYRSRSVCSIQFLYWRQWNSLGSNSRKCFCRWTCYQNSQSPAGEKEQNFFFTNMGKWCVRNLTLEYFWSCLYNQEPAMPLNFKGSKYFPGLISNIALWSYKYLNLMSDFLLSLLSSSLSQLLISITITLFQERGFTLRSQTVLLDTF